MLTSKGNSVECESNGVRSSRRSAEGTGKLEPDDFTSNLIHRALKPSVADGSLGLYQHRVTCYIAQKKQKTYGFLVRRTEYDARSTLSETRHGKAVSSVSAVSNV
jgi:hypothetical protein